MHQSGPHPRPLTHIPAPQHHQRGKEGDPNLLGEKSPIGSPMGSINNWCLISHALITYEGLWININGKTIEKFSLSVKLSCSCTAGWGAEASSSFSYVALEVILTVAVKELPWRFREVNYLQEEHALPQGEFSPLQMSLGGRSDFSQKQPCLKRIRNTPAKVKAQRRATRLFYI